MTVCLLTSTLPGARQTGGEVVTYAFVEALRAAGHETWVVGYRRPGDDPPRHPHDIDAGERVIETREAGRRAATWMARALARREPYTFAKFASARYRRVVRELLGERSPDALVLDHCALAWSLPSAEARPSWAYLAHNVEHRIYAAQARDAAGLRRWINGREARLLKRVEAELATAAGQVWTLSDADAAALSALGAAGRTRTFEVPLPAASPPPADTEVDVAILGTWSWEANRAGLRWFLDEVCPRLGGSLTVEVAGAGTDGLVPPPGVRMRGRVPEAIPFLQRARAVAVPSVAGEGVQIKTLDAIASGRPLVATPLAMRGLDDLPSTVAVAADADAFATRLVQAAAAPHDPAAAEAATAWVQGRRRSFEGAVATAVNDLVGGT